MDDDIRTLVLLKYKIPTRKEYVSLTWNKLYALYPKEPVDNLERVIQGYNTFIEDLIIKLQRYEDKHNG